MRRSEHPDARPTGAAKFDECALSFCSSCGQRVTAVQGWERLRPIAYDAICVEVPRDAWYAWYELSPCGCEVDHFEYRVTEILATTARETTGRHLSAGGA